MACPLFLFLFCGGQLFFYLSKGLGVFGGSHGWEGFDKSSLDYREFALLLI